MNRPNRASRRRHILWSGSENRHYAASSEAMTLADIQHAVATLEKANVPKFDGEYYSSSPQVPPGIAAAFNAERASNPTAFLSIVQQLAWNRGSHQRRRTWTRKAMVRAQKHPEIIAPVEAAYKLGGLDAAHVLLADLMAKTNKRAGRRNG